MSDLKVYGAVLSQPTRSVLAYLKLSGIQYTYEEIGLFDGSLETESFTKINPFHKAPAIVHGDFSVWESPAIVTYLADAYDVDNHWYPKDIKIRARINAYLHWHHQGTREPLVTYLIRKIIAPVAFGAPALTPEQEEPLLAKVNEYFTTLTWILSETGNIARTANPTIADVFAHSEILTFLAGTNFDLTPFPSVKAWFDQLATNEIVQEFDTIGREAALKVISH